MYVCTKIKRKRKRLCVREREKIIFGCINNSASSGVCKCGCECDWHFLSKWRPSSQITSIMSLGK